MSNQINLKGVLCTLLLFFFLLPSVQADTMVVNQSYFSKTLVKISSIVR